MRVILWFWIILRVVPVGASILHVPDEYSHIQSALDASQSGDTVLVAPGHYHERLVFPLHDLMLVSHILLSGDTLALDETILDGDSLGTTVTIPAGSRSAHVQGFTIRGGSGGEFRGGGLHIGDGVRAVVRHIKFAENFSTTIPALYTTSNAERVEMEFIRLDGNVAINGSKQISVYVTDLAVLRNFHVLEPQGGNLVSLVAIDSVLVQDMVIRNQTASPFIQIQTLGPSNFGYTELRDSYFQNNRIEKGTLIAASSSTYMVANDCWFTDNEQYGDYYESGDRHTLATFSSQSNTNVDRLYFLRNRAKIAAGAGSRFFGINGAWVNNLVIRDCVVGDSNFVDNQDYIGQSLLETYLGRLNNCDLSNNTIIHRSSDTNPRIPSIDGPCLFYGDRTILIDSCTFNDNEFVDLDFQQAATNYPRGNTGWGIVVETSHMTNFYIKNCRFENNRMDNMPAESNWYWYYHGAFSRIGSFMYLTLHYYPESPNYLLENCVFNNNDDGGLQAGGNDLMVKNLILRNITKRAFSYHGSQLTMSNVWVEGIQRHRPSATGSLQVAMKIRSRAQAVVSNATFDNNQIPALLDPGRDPDPQYHDTYQPTLFMNSLFTDNYSSGLTQYQDTGEFSYCVWPGSQSDEAEFVSHPLPNLCLPVEFHPLLGPPYLAHNSKCVDRGHPDPIWNDREDASLPGMALWPSQGSLRADLGYTGGPHVEGGYPMPVRETALVGSPLPVGLHLGVPFPNPFNPMTQVEFDVERATAYELAVFNVLGQRVARRDLGWLAPGRHAARWDGRGSDGRNLASGTYFLRVADAQGRGAVAPCQLQR